MMQEGSMYEGSYSSHSYDQPEIEGVKITPVGKKTSLAWGLVFSTISSILVLIVLMVAYHMWWLVTYSATFGNMDDFSSLRMCIYLITTLIIGLIILVNFLFYRWRQK